MKYEKKDIETFLVDYTCSHFGCDSSAVYSADNFFREGLIDSFGFMQLIMEIERACGIGFSQEELMTNSFSNLKDMVKTIEKKRG